MKLETNAGHAPAGEAHRSRRQFWVLVAIFFVPLAIAFYLYYGLDGWRPAGSTAHGDLIDPARPLPAVALETPSGEPLPADFLRGKWTLVYVGEGRCDARCREALTDMRQVRLALADDMTRVERVSLYAGDFGDPGYFAAEHAGLTAAALDGAGGADLLAEFAVDGDVPVPAAGRVYIVDPLGNLMMSYGPEAPAKGMLEDLEKLLKLSHIG